MAKFIKPFLGCPLQVIHPIAFGIGDECPKELEDAARATGSLPPKGKKLTKAEQKAIDDAKAAEEADAALQELEDAGTDATDALAADPDNADLKSVKEDAEKALSDAQSE